jgi:endonuclease YncB( thermonuclease family)
MRRLLRSTPAIALALAALTAGISSPQAGAQSRIFQVPCIPGSAAPLCYAEDAQLLYVDDGDTIDVRIPGASSRSRVRLTGLNATEQSVYSSNPASQRGECHALDATTLLTNLIKRSNDQVRLVFENRLTRAGVRLVKTIQVFVRGSWHDAGSLLVSRGEALFLPNGKETAWNRQYMFLSQQAASRGLGMFDTTFCGFGPDQDIPIKVTVRPNAPGDDTLNINGEIVRIFNLGTRPLNLGGWWIRDSSTRRYVFPTGAVVPAGDKITVHVGKGDDTPDTYYWGLNTPIFDNPTNDDRAIGDGAYLFDPDGDARAWMFYPCRIDPCPNS